MLRPLVCVVALLSAPLSGVALAQRSLHGTVKDAQTGSPIAAAQVSVQGTRAWASSGSDGQFTMTAPAGAVTLAVRRIGFVSANVPVAADQSDIQITLKATALELSEVIVTGQATGVARRNLANNVQSVAGDALTRTHSETIENALQGMVPGAVITANSGAPGGGMQVRMQGVTSIFGRSQPLYVLDGVPVANTAISNGLNAVTAAGAGLDASNQDNPVNRIADLNPSDVQSIEFLEGPSAAAIYGSSAANGVVVITTKHGTPGPARFSVSQRLGTHVLANTLGLRRFNLSDAIAYSAGTFCTGNPPPMCSADTAAVTQMFQASGGFQDFEQQVYGDKSLSYETNVSVSGGNENTQYFFSGLNQHDNGIMYGTGYDKQGLRLNLTQLVGSKLQIKANTNLLHSLTKRGISNNDNVNITPYFVIGETPSFFDMRPASGVYPFNPFTFGSGTNLLQTLSQFQLPEDVFRLIGSVNATYTFLSGETHTLRATVDAGIDSYQDKANIYAPATLYWQQTSLPGLASDLTGTETQTTVAATLTHAYSPTSKAFTATTSAGVRGGYDYFRTNNVVTQNLLPGQQNVDRGTAVSVFENRQKTRTQALFAQEELLLFDERLFVSGGVLAQKSTNNANNGDVNKLFYYPKAAASFRWPTLGPFEELKIRVAYGQTGNEPLYGQKFTCLTGLTYTGENALAIAAPCNVVGDPNLHPEREREIEAGFDAGLFNSRVALSATVYQKNNTDLILQQTLAPSTGYATRIYNGGSGADIRNRGIDVSISGFPLRTRDASWLARVTFAKNTGVVDTLSVPAFAPANSFGFSYGAGFIQQGASPSQIYGRDGKGGVAALGDYEPKFTMGFASDISYRRFRLSGLLEWRHGGDVVNVTQNVFDEDGIAPDSAASAARLAAFHATGKRLAVYIQDASFVKLREITLSYQLPDDIIRNLFRGSVTGARAELSGRNLATWSKYAGLDPEVSNFGNQNINRGQDLAPYPPSRSFFFTIAVDF
ncbi:MAG TPA: SusC/RagA family TonB-linked outer membrane protein [Gemmatimonadales bacterium]|nr:SusC/RagA family TonB-linked outer membrane protein [Gemmatimonadales bacterium]